MREIAKVYAPDAWFLKRGTTAAARLRHALVGNAFTAARRRGKQIVLDTKDPDVRLGVHLGMSGRVLVDDVEAGDPLRLREQPASSRMAPVRRPLRRRRQTSCSAILGGSARSSSIPTSRASVPTR